MKARTFKHYYIVDFVRCGSKSTVEIEDCSTEEIKSHCHKLFRPYMTKPDEKATGTKVRIRMIKKDGSMDVYGATLYHKSPFQFRKMLENTLSE